MSKHNYFIRFLITTNKFINSLLKRNLNKLNAANLKKILINNKVFLSIVLLVILFFSYLSLPNIFEKELNYNFLPRPHFTINESSVTLNANKISKINELKIYVSFKNLFSIKNIKIQNVIIKEANFNLNKNNYGLFVKLLDSDFRDIKFEILDSNIFYRNLENDVLFINHI